MHRRVILGCIHILLRLISSSQSHAFKIAARLDGPAVDLGYANYTGIVNQATGVTRFLGIRYAASPTGALRWRAPQDPTPISGVQLADTQPPACINPGGIPSGSNSESENCLFVSVYTPGIQQKELLPVMVWIHGGAYIGGSSPVYYGDHLIQEAAQRLVVVSIQYRLGIFGFLAGNAVKQGGDLNVGLLDQHFALTWVNKYIKSFGGDPEKVTIAGSSAGAGSVLQQVIAQDGETFPPLFRAAMTSSTFLPPQYNYDHWIPEAIYSSVLSQAGCSSSSDSLTCLRAIDIGTLQNINNNVPALFPVTFLPAPVVDGTFITQRPTEALRSRKLNGEVLLGISDAHEGNVFVNQGLTNIHAFIAQLFPTFGQQEINATVAQYSGFGSTADQANTIMGEGKEQSWNTILSTDKPWSLAIFVCPTYFVQQAFIGRSFKAEYAVPPALHDMGTPFYFPPASPGQLPFNNQTFINAYGQALTNFILALDPNFKTDPTNITPYWNRWNERFEMLFNRTEDGLPDIREITTDPSLLKRCAFWESLSATTNQ